MTLNRQGRRAADFLVFGLIITMVLGIGLPPPEFDAFGYGLDHALGFGLGVYLSAVPDAIGLMWIVGRSCRTKGGTAIRWSVFAVAVLVFVGLTVVIQVRLHPLMTLEWLAVVAIARLFVFSGVALLWAIPFQFWATKRAKQEPQTVGPRSECQGADARQPTEEQALSKAHSKSTP